MNYRAAFFVVLLVAILSAGVFLMDRYAFPSAGFQLEVFNGQNFDRSAGRSTSRTISSDFPVSVPDAFFSARWTGYWYVPRTSLYRIEAAADDAIVVKIDDTQFLIRDRSHGFDAAQETVPLTQGFHKVEADYQQLSGALYAEAHFGAVSTISELFNPPLIFTQPASHISLVVAIISRGLRRLLLAQIFVAIVFLLWLLLRSVRAPQPRVMKAVHLLVPALIVLYAGLLRFEALTIKHGVVEKPALVRILQEHVGWIGSMHPSGLRWQFGSNPYEKGDPMNYLRFAREMVHFYGAAFREPFYVYVTKQSLWIFDQKDIAVSLGSALFSTLAVLATFLLGSYAFSWGTGVMAATALAIEAEAISLGVDGWRDDTFMFLVLMFSYSLLRLHRRGTLPDALLAGVFGAACCLTRMTSFSFVVPGYIFVLLFSKSLPFVKRLQRVSISAALVALLIAPYLIGCAFAFGDPLFCINDNTKFYRNRENLPAETQMPVSEYLKSKLVMRPFKFIDIGLIGFTAYPFWNKWKGFNYWSPGLGIFLSLCSILGLCFMLFSSNGRLVLLLLFTSLIPYAFTYEIRGGAEWRFTLHAYPFYLIAAGMIIVSVLRLKSPKSSWNMLSDRKPSVRFIAGMLVVVGLILVGGNVLLLETNFLVKREAGRLTGSFLVAGAPRDSRFFGGGWSSSSEFHGKLVRFTQGAESYLSLPLPPGRDYLVSLAMDPVWQSEGRDISVVVNGKTTGSFELKDASESLDVTIPGSQIRDSMTEVALVHKAEEKGELAFSYLKVQPYDSFARGMEDYQLGNFARAKIEFEEALKTGRRRPVALYYLGLYDLKLHDPAAAVQKFSEALALSKRNPDILLARAQAYHELGQNAQAIEDLAKVLKSQPENQQAKELLAACSRESGPEKQ